MTAVDAGVHGFMWLMRRLHGRSVRQEERRWDRPDPLAAGRSLDALKRDYQGYEAIGGVIFFIVAPALVFVWLAIFQAIGAAAAPDPGAAGRVLGASVWAWSLPALFAAIVTSAWPCLWLMRLMLAERYEEYLLYTNKRVGFDAHKVVKAMAAVFAILVVLCTGYFATSYTAFLEDRIVISGALVEARSLPYSEIVAIRAVPGRPASRSKGLEVRPGHYEILFRDGSLWRSKDGARDSRPRCDYAVMALVAERAWRRIAGPDIVTGDRTSGTCR